MLQRKYSISRYRIDISQNNHHMLISHCKPSEVRISHNYSSIHQKIPIDETPPFIRFSKRFSSTWKHTKNRMSEIFFPQFFPNFRFLRCALTLTVNSTLDIGLTQFFRTPFFLIAVHPSLRWRRLRFIIPDTTLNTRPKIALLPTTSSYFTRNCTGLLTLRRVILLALISLCAC